MGYHRQGERELSSTGRGSYHRQGERELSSTGGGSNHRQREGTIDEDRVTIDRGREPLTERE